MSSLSLEATRPHRRSGAASPWWPAIRLPEAMAVLSGQTSVRDRPVPAGSAEDGRVWMAGSRSADGAGFAEVTIPTEEAARRFARLGPAILWHPGAAAFLVLRGAGRLLCPDGRIVRRDGAWIAAAHLPALPRALQGRIGRIVDAAGVPADRRAILAAALRQRIEAGQVHDGIWLLRGPADPPVLSLLLRGRMPLQVLAIFLMSLLSQGLVVLLWTVAMTGPVGGSARTHAITLLLLASIPISLWLALTHAALGRQLAVVLRRRVFEASLRLSPETARGEGAAGLMARVFETEALERAGVAALFGLVSAASGLCWTLWLLSQATPERALVALLAAALVLQGVCALVHRRELLIWTRARGAAAAAMIERMMGHRTILVQERAADRADRLAAALRPYAEASRRQDRAGLALTALAPLGWAVGSMILLRPLYVSGTDPAGVALAVGGMVLGARTLGALAGTLTALSGSLAGWSELRGFLTAARPASVRAGAVGTVARPGALLVGTALEVGGHDGGRLLAPFDLDIGKGDRILVEGASGSGKSSLLRVLVGLDPPLGGSLQAPVGPAGNAASGQTLALAPQFHDNHVFTGSLAYNLLLARSWPPAPGDLADAETIARALGLGPLIDEMPGGMTTQVGDTGWQLSQGERSRVFLARTLLQDAPVVALDESLAALDPETMALCLDAIRRFSAASVIVAHR